MRIHVCGASMVGKTAFCVQLVSKYFVEVHDPTNKDSYRKQISVDGQVLSVELVDLNDLSGLSLKAGHGVMLVYDITARESFTEVQRLYAEIANLAAASGEQFIAAVLIGNKYDLRSQRQVSAEEARDWAAANDMSYFETSAADRTNVEESVYHLLHRLLRVTGSKDEERRQQDEERQKQQQTHVKASCCLM